MANNFQERFFKNFRNSLKNIFSGLVIYLVAYFFQDYLSSKANSVNFSDSMKQEFGYARYDQFVVKCSFNQAPCSLDIYAYYYDNFYGNCIK